MSPTEFTHSPVIPIAAPFDLTDYPELAGISGISGTGLVTRIGVGSYATRTLTGTTNQVNVADGNGVAGNPTISLPQNIHTAASPTFAGITLSGMTSGSVLFAGTSGVVSQDNSNLYWDDTNNRLGIGLSSFGTNGRLQVLTSIGISGTGVIRPVSNSDVDSLQFLGTKCTIGYANSFAYSYTGGALVSAIGNADNLRLIDVGRSDEATAGRFFVRNSSSGHVGIELKHGATYTLQAFTNTGTTLLGTSTETASSGRLQLATHTTAAGGILWGTDTNLYRSAANTLKTDDALTVAGTTASTSSTTGALIVSGGVGIAKALYVANDLVVTPAASANRAVTITGSNGGNPTIDVSAGSLAITPATVFASTITTIGGATFHTTSTALTDGAGAGAGTLTNAPAAGDPTKWIGINDNGTTRYIPAW